MFGGEPYPSLPLPASVHALVVIAAIPRCATRPEHTRSEPSHTHTRWANPPVSRASSHVLYKGGNVTAGGGRSSVVFYIVAYGRGRCSRNWWGGPSTPLGSTTRHVSRWPVWIPTPTGDTQGTVTVLATLATYAFEMILAGCADHEADPARPEKREATAARWWTHVRSHTSLFSP
ncbi:uncharacterized protein EV422DRAFT_265156 [Fimicolochytrium jonesii]|uniref:uncharacterized protein n=1 Tax=Fimicolochytrium jonesii TaxID=1396493 RepID=UPI0022FEAD09|nr:uncharacterized protein EV422DRAFT_265156 [Fimicolochytrium jonesii]KAI8816907.1 hypothetical protein EV422DRAFT_265156 [Fimicolochytrium jonesii]